VLLLVTGAVNDIRDHCRSVCFTSTPAGVYGALANVIAIPLITAVTFNSRSPWRSDFIGDGGAGLGRLCGKSFDLMLALAHLVAGQPGAAYHAAGTLGTTSIAFLRRRWALVVLVARPGGVLGVGPCRRDSVAALLRAPDILVSGEWPSRRHYR
jgi:competence protein ComEC